MKVSELKRVCGYFVCVFCDILVGTEWDRTESQCRGLGRRHAAVKPRNFGGTARLRVWKQNRARERRGGFSKRKAIN